MTATTHHTPWRQCPTCGALHDAASNLTGTNEPGEGDALICWHCGEWGIHDSTAPGGWRLPTGAERREFAADDRFMRALFLNRVRLDHEERDR